MAFVQNKGCIRTLEHEAFNAIHKPGTKVPYSGIYQCQARVVTMRSHPMQMVAIDSRRRITISILPNRVLSDGNSL